MRKTHRPLFVTIFLLILGLLVGLSTWTYAADTQQTFDSPGAAVDALVTATEAGDMKTLRSILGSDAEPILSSGDPVADQNARDNFAAKYREMHRSTYNAQGRVILYVGAENWPLPIPVVKKDNAWLFDTSAGAAELVYRRIGQNELHTIGVLNELTRAQREYASEERGGGSTKQFARKILSDPRTHNGLYWTVAEGEPVSPIGPLVAKRHRRGVQEGHLR